MRLLVLALLLPACADLALAAGGAGRSFEPPLRFSRALGVNLSDAGLKGAFVRVMQQAAVDPSRFNFAKHEPEAYAEQTRSRLLMHARRLLADWGRALELERREGRPMSPETLAKRAMELEDLSAISAAIPDPNLAKAVISAGQAAAQRAGGEAPDLLRRHRAEIELEFSEGKTRELGETLGAVEKDPTKVEFQAQHGLSLPARYDLGPLKEFLERLSAPPVEGAPALDILPVLDEAAGRLTGWKEPVDRIEALRGLILALHAREKLDREGLSGGPGEVVFKNEQGSLRYDGLSAQLERTGALPAALSINAEGELLARDRRTGVVTVMGRVAKEPVALRQINRRVLKGLDGLALQERYEGDAARAWVGPQGEILALLTTNDAEPELEAGQALVVFKVRTQPRRLVDELLMLKGELSDTAKSTLAESVSALNARILERNKEDQSLAAALADKPLAYSPAGYWARGEYRAPVRFEDLARGLYYSFDFPKGSVFLMRRGPASKPGAPRLMSLTRDQEGRFLADGRLANPEEMILGLYVFLQGDMLWVAARLAEPVSARLLPLADQDAAVDIMTALEKGRRWAAQALTQWSNDSPSARIGATVDKMDGRIKNLSNLDFSFYLRDGRIVSWEGGHDLSARAESNIEAAVELYNHRAALREEEHERGRVAANQDVVAKLSAVLAKPYYSFFERFLGSRRYDARGLRTMKLRVKADSGEPLGFSEGPLPAGAARVSVVYDSRGVIEDLSYLRQGEPATPYETSLGLEGRLSLDAVGNLLAARKRHWRNRH